MPDGHPKSAGSGGEFWSYDRKVTSVSTTDATATSVTAAGFETPRGSVVKVRLSGIAFTAARDGKVFQAVDGLVIRPTSATAAPVSAEIIALGAPTGLAQDADAVTWSMTWDLVASGGLSTVITPVVTGEAATTVFWIVELETWRAAI